PPAVVSVDVRGGGPGTRETDLLDPSRPADRIDAIALSGGSAFGLDSAGGLQAYLRSIGRGYEVGTARVLLVPGAILFDLLNGGDKEWGRYPPYRDLGFAAAQARGRPVVLGGPVRAERRIRRPRFPGDGASRRPAAAHQGRDADEHHAGGGRDRCRTDQ